jgi:hypothetical protein
VLAEAVYGRMELQRGETMAAKSLDERLSRLEEQSELNRQGINAIIDLINKISDMFSSAMGHLKQIPKLPHIEAVNGEDDK